MEDHSYKVIELVGSSTTSVEDAIQHALGRAARNLHGLRWFQVIEIRGSVADGKVGHYQVTVKVGFTVDATA
jgi:hypothetical protein